ncbi:hypothetical protein pb186bvf_004774 [Paramecium bursaria]
MKHQKYKEFQKQNIVSLIFIYEIMNICQEEKKYIQYVSSIQENFTNKNHDVGANDVLHNRDSLHFDISMIFFILDSNHDNIYEVLEICFNTFQIIRNISERKLSNNDKLLWREFGLEIKKKNSRKRLKTSTNPIIRTIHFKNIFHYLNFKNTHMVYLRSGQTAGQTIERKYQNAEDVYRKETREEFKKKYPDLNTAREAQKKGWKALSEKQKEKYARLYDESVKEYDDNLVLFYGGTKKDITAAQEIQRIPPKPKHPLNALFRYLQEHRADYMKAHPEKSLTEATKELSLQYSKLADKQKRPYEIETRKENDAWQKEMDKWENQYGDKFKEGQKVLKNQHKYHSQGRQKGFQYQEILSAKQRRMLLPLGDDDTKQVGGRGRGRQSEKSPNDRKRRQQEEEDRRSNDYYQEHKQIVNNSLKYIYGVDLWRIKKIKEYQIGENKF